MSGMATAQGWTRHWLAAEFREKGKKLDCRDTTRRHAKLSTCQKGCPHRHAKTRLSPSTCKKNCLRRHAKQDCLCPHAKKIVSVDMQKCSCRHARGDCLRRHAKKIVPVDMPNKIVSVDTQKRLFLSTCKKRLSPSTCKKDSSRRHAKKLSPSTCQHSGRRYAKTRVSADMPKSVVNIPGVVSVDMPRGFVRQFAKGSCSFVHRPNHLLEWQNHSPTSPWAISVHTDKSCVLQRS